MLICHLLIFLTCKKNADFLHVIIYCIIVLIKKNIFSLLQLNGSLFNRCDHNSNSTYVSSGKQILTSFEIFCMKRKHNRDIIVLLGFMLIARRVQDVQHYAVSGLKGTISIILLREMHYSIMFSPSCNLKANEKKSFLCLCEEVF